MEAIKEVEEMLRTEVTKRVKEMHALEATEPKMACVRKMELDSFIEGVERTSIWAFGVDVYKEIHEFILDLMDDLEE